MQYRPEIDGLRAIAVMPVVFFHAGIEIFSGGYVGVDIFFVISGYLITSIIISELSVKKFSLLGFYERRARRILPALFFMMAVCLPFAWYLFLPHELKGFSQSLVAVSTYTANIYFWISTGYFEIAAELRPLLHTWSLAVEEQFYFLFPILILIGIRWGKKFILFSIIFVALLSLLLAQYLSDAKPSFAFYLLPTRIWELLVGALIAFYFEYRQDLVRKRIINELGSLVGLCLIAYAIFFFDKQTPFPSFYAVIPVLGAALIIVYANKDTLFGKMLSFKLIVSLGLISYSLYLWHQPVLAFARAFSGNELTISSLVFLATLVFLVAYFSWKYVERPFRNNKKFTRKQVLLYSFIASGFFIGIGLVGQFTNGFLTKDQAAVLAYNEYDSETEEIGLTGNCFWGPEDGPEKFTNQCISKNTGESVLIWGDSHAAGLAFGLRKFYPNLSQFTVSGCPPILDEDIKTRPKCRMMNDLIIDKVKLIQPSQIFLYANWDAYGDQKPSVNLSRTINAIRSVSPITRITLVGGTPQFKPSLPTLMFLNNKNLTLNETLTTYLYDSLSYMDSQFLEFSGKNRIEFFSPLKAFCKESLCNVTATFDGKIMPIIWDYGHLTSAGALFLAQQIEKK